MPLADKLGHRIVAGWSRFEALVDAALPAPRPRVAPTPDDHLYVDGAVFGKPRVTAFHDTVWQSDPPRMLRYKPAVLHSWGWVPGLIPRNFKGTVFRDPHVWTQIAGLWTWMLLIRATGLFAAPRDIKAFVLFFGAPYMAAILNLCMVITFTLGLFVTLVVNRWWDIRVNYGAARSLSIELAYIVSTNLRAAKGAAGGGARPLSESQNAFARSEVVRYLNFAHLLMLCEAQRAEKGDFSESPEARVGRWARRTLAAAPVLRHLLKLEASLDGGMSSLGDVMGSPGSLLRSLKNATFGLVSGVTAAVADVGSAVKALSTGTKLEMSDAGLGAVAAQRAAAAAASSAAREVDFQQFYVMGLVTPDEWALIRTAEREGIPNWRTVYNWVASLLADASAAGRLDERVATAGGMQAMCMEIRNAGGRVFTMMNTQLPYTYVHLVSFICHTYLFILATYFGFVLNIGIPGINWAVEVDGTDRVAVWSGAIAQHPTNGKKDGDGPLMRCFIFFIVAFASTILQGLLAMHSLLENPFGTHPCKFPLRAYNIDHIRQTRAMLRDPTEREPSSVRTMFAFKGRGGGHAHAQGDNHKPGGAGAAGRAHSLADDGRAKKVHFVANNDTQARPPVISFFCFLVRFVRFFTRSIPPPRCTRTCSRRATTRASDEPP